MAGQAREARAAAGAAADGLARRVRDEEPQLRRRRLGRVLPDARRDLEPGRRTPAIPRSRSCRSSGSWTRPRRSRSSGWRRASRSTTRTPTASGSRTSSARPSSTAAATRRSWPRPRSCFPSARPRRPRRPGSSMWPPLSLRPAEVASSLGAAALAHRRDASRASARPVARTAAPQVEEYLAVGEGRARQPVVRVVHDLVARAGRAQDAGRRLGRRADLGAQRRAGQQRAQDRQRRGRAARGHRRLRLGRPERLRRRRPHRVPQERRQGRQVHRAGGQQQRRGRRRPARARAARTSCSSASTATPPAGGGAPPVDPPRPRPPAAASQPIDPEQFGGEGTGTGGPPSAEALALLDNKNIVLDSTGIADIKAGRIDPRVIGVLTKLSQEHEITVSCMCSDHSKFTAGGSVSNHFFGRGVDIAAIDGEIVGPGSAVAREVASELRRWTRTSARTRSARRGRSPVPATSPTPRTRTTSTSASRRRSRRTGSRPRDVAATRAPWRPSPPCRARPSRPRAAAPPPPPGLAAVPEGRHAPKRPRRRRRRSRASRSCS